MERCRPADLTCNLLDTPLAVPRTTPLFGWGRGCRCGTHDQYRITAASTEHGLASGDVNLWDTGWRTRDDRPLVPYMGRPLGPRQAVHWRVGIRSDPSGVGEAVWSEPSRFVTAPDDPAGQWVWAPSVTPNQHVLLRGSVTLPDVDIAHATLSISADDTFGLWIDGHRLGRGPCPSWPRQQPYQSFDVTEFARSRSSLTVAVHAHHLGMINWAIVSGDGRAGVRAWLDVVTPDQTVVPIEWDWQQLVCEGYPAGHVLGYDTAVTEDIDARRIPSNWQHPDFDDRCWTPAAPVAEPDWTLVPQRTAPVTEHRLLPVSEVATPTGEERSVTVDFGREVVGAFGLRTGPDAAVYDVGLGEELTADGEIRTELRCNCRYEERWTSDGTPRELQHHGDRAFRYARVRVVEGNSPVPEVFAVLSHYPFDGNRAQFRSSDARLDRLWQLSVDSMRHGRQELMMDCPSRERANYGLDSLMMQQAAAVLDGEYVQGAHMAELLLESRVDGFPRAVAPASRDHHFTEYSLYPVLMVWLHHQHTADTDFVRRWLPALLEILDAFATTFRVPGSALLGGTNEVLRDLVDWPTTMRDGHQMAWINSVPNAVHHRAVEATAQLAAAVGETETSARLARQADAIRTEFHDRLYDPEHGHYRDGLDETGESTDHSSLHSNVFALRMGLVPDELQSTVGRQVAERGWRGNLFVGWFLLEVLFEYGQGAAALRALVDDEIAGPARMVAAGATTTWEAWDLDLKPNISLCHPAGAVMGAEMVTGISGIRPLEPGHRRFRARPRPDLVAECALTVPTPYGPIELAWEQSGTTTTCTLAVPIGTTCRFVVPSGQAMRDGVPGTELGPGQHQVTMVGADRRP